MLELLRRFFHGLNIAWTIAFALAGAVIGAVLGYGNAGWIGAIALAFCGIILGALASQAIF